MPIFVESSHKHDIPTTMHKTLRNITLILPLLFSAGCAKKQPPSLFHELHDVQKLALAEMTVNKVGTISDNGANGINAIVNGLKVGKRIAAYSFHTYIEAYIDLSELREEDIDVNSRQKFVTITLPPVRTRYIGRDIGVTEEHYRVSGLRSQISAEERAQLKERMSKSLKEEVNANDEYRRILVDQARSKAEGFFTILLKDRGYDCKIKFRT